jgi:hypothetical protein
MTMAHVVDGDFWLHVDGRPAPDRASGTKAPATGRSGCTPCTWSKRASRSPRRLNRENGLTALGAIPSTRRQSLLPCAECRATAPHPTHLRRHDDGVPPQLAATPRPRAPENY